MIRTFKYRLYPTKVQISVLSRHLQICGGIYHYFLQERKDYWDAHKISISFIEQCGDLPELKIRQPELAIVYAQVLQDVVRRVDKTFKAFFRRIKNGEIPGYPRDKPLSRYKSFTYPQSGFRLVEQKLIVSKIGEIKIKLHRPVNGKIKTLSIKREGEKWFAIFSVEVNEKRLPPNDNHIGIDLGLTEFAAFSDLNRPNISNPRLLQATQRKLRCVARRLARRKKGSNRRYKARILVEKVHERIRRQRGDFCHKESRKIINDYGYISVENLNVKAMMRNHHFSKLISDVGWSGFIYKIAYKAENAGRIFVKVDPQYTSQICICGAPNSKNLSQRWHTCLKCGLSLPRDRVSAMVIDRLGLSRRELT